MGIYELFFVILHVLGMRIYNTVIFYLYSTTICTVLQGFIENVNHLINLDFKTSQHTTQC